MSSMINSHLKIYSLILMLAMFWNGNAIAADHCDRPITSFAIELETNFWNLVQDHDVEGFSNKMSHIFQGLGPSGIISRDQQIASLSNANIDVFSLLNVVVTHHHGVIIISYYFSVVGTGVVSGPTISVWKQEKHHWKMISHSYNSQSVLL